MLTVLVQRHGIVEQVDAVDPAWLTPGATEVLWADIEAPGEVDRRLLLDVFRIHELAVEDALSEIHFPKIETYDALLGAPSMGGFFNRHISGASGARFACRN